MRIAGIKYTKTASGQLKEVVINYKKFASHIDDLLDVIRAEKILKEDKERFTMEEVFKQEYKRRGIKNNV